jgi:transposase
MLLLREAREVESHLEDRCAGEFSAEGMTSMQVLYERCCGLDVHKKTVTVCLITPDVREVRTFGTFTEDLRALQDWLLSHGCTHVAMESTGVYWKPIWNLLEGTGMELLLVNARDLKAVPGRKTDVKDAEWITDLMRHGLLRGSFVPDRAQRELRELVRYRRSLIDERSREANRIQKLLEGANVKLASVATDVLGKSGKAMLQAIADGETDPKVLASLALGKLKNKRPQLEKALEGLIGSHQRHLLAIQLRHVFFLDDEIDRLSAEIKERMRPFQAEIELLETIPGVARQTAEEVLAEIGTDMEQFPTGGHLASWAGVCPGNNESAGKRKSGRTRKGNKHLRATLVRSAHSAARTRNTYLSVQYKRLAARRGSKRAAVAVAHTILVCMHAMLKYVVPYEDPGHDFYDQLRKDRVISSAVRRIEALGYKVTVQEVA